MVAQALCGEILWEALAASVAVVLVVAPAVEAAAVLVEAQVAEVEALSVVEP